TVLTVDSEAWGGAALADGDLGVRWGVAGTRHHVAVTTRDVRIRQAILTLDSGLETAASATRDLFALQGLMRALGVGLTDTTGELTSRYPTPGADTRVAMAALRHLYATPCSQDARLDDTVGGDRSQRVTAGTRARIDLADDAGTAIAAAVDVAGWLTGQRGSGWAAGAVVCRDEVHADCLAGTALVRSNGPILFVPGGPDGTLPAAVRDALAAALGTAAEVHVLGGPAAVSDGIVSELQRTLPGRQVSRIAGEDRYATAAAVAREVVARGGSTTHALVTRADDPADAVAAGAAAAERGIPVLLTATDRLPAVTQLTLTELGTSTVLIAGGTAAVSDQVGAILRSRGHAVVRMAGRDRFETAVEVARAPALWSRTEVRRSGSVIGLNGRHAQTWNLALAAAPVGAYLDAPVLFTTADGLPSLQPTTGHPGGTLEQLRNLGVTGPGPTVQTVFVGAGAWTADATAEAFHAQALPGFGGNLTVTAG
ncbi:MAG TPA: cell wall-binding repeat-containing protein, partial [Nitriliruptorales bacterium]